LFTLNVKQAPTRVLFWPALQANSVCQQVRASVLMLCHQSVSVLAKLAGS